jgi:hypothetical protein
LKVEILHVIDIVVKMFSDDHSCPTPSPQAAIGTTYIYNPLMSTDSIRLFKLEPRDSETPLEGTLTTVSLSDTALSFSTLSYTWGNPLEDDSQFFEPYNTSKHYVSCDGKQIEVTENLRDALWHLRQFNDIAYLWIDAICS